MNQNFSKLFAQLRDIWNQLGASQRITVLAATLVLFGGLGAIAFWSSHTDYGLLYGGLSDTQAAKVVSALQDAKVPYKIGSDGGTILVPQDKVYAMRMQLASRGIPQTDGVGFEIFDKPNFGISDFVQHADYVRAVQGELARTISQINEVQAARVMIVMPRNQLLLDKTKYPTASVFVRLQGDSQLRQESVSAIQFLVANSVEGLKPNHVTVVDNHGDVLSEDDDNNSVAGLTTSQLGARRNLEKYLAQKAQDMLEKVLGPGQAVVRVSADINYNTLTQTQQKYDPNGQVISSETKNDELNDTSSSSDNTPVGISANTSTSTNSSMASTGPVNNSKKQTTTSTVKYANGYTTSNLIQAAGGIKRLTAAVTIAEQTKGTGAKKKLVARTPAQLAQLRSIVAGALGIDPSRGDTITLEELPFNNQFADEMNQQLDEQQKQEFWWKLARRFSFPALGLLALLVLLRMFKRAPIQDIPIGIPVGRLVTQKNGNGNGNGHFHVGETFEPQPGVVTVDVLNRLIKENPGNMTQAIRDWMNKGRTSEQN